ncbi:MAG: hypothetical protein IT449_10335 [Phycisphaerales bacterium]|nr:hypothetical protein [Phycisphaerales bacterium]
MVTIFLLIFVYTCFAVFAVALLVVSSQSPSIPFTIGGDRWLGASNKSEHESYVQAAIEDHNLVLSLFCERSIGGSGIGLWFPIWRNRRIVPGIVYFEVETRASVPATREIAIGLTRGLKIAIWIPFLLAFLPLVLTFIARHVMRSVQEARQHPCCRCGYDLTGNVSGVCPECGVPLLEEFKSMKQNATVRNNWKRNR